MNFMDRLHAGLAANDGFAPEPTDDDASRLAQVEQLVEDARDKGNTSIDTCLLLDALGLEG